MKRIVPSGSVVTLIAVLAACAPAEREPVDVSADIGEVRDGYIEAYNRHDAAAVAELYAADAVFVTSQGDEFAGREEIRRQLESFFFETRPRLTATASATEGGERLGWELGSYRLELQPTAAAPAPGQPATPAPGPPGATTEPVRQGQPGTPAEPSQPVTTAQPGQPGATAQPGPPAAAQSESGHYLIVLERGDDDRWLIRAHLGQSAAPAGPGLPPLQQPAATTPAPAPGQERPLEPPPAAGEARAGTGGEATTPTTPPAPERDQPADEHEGHDDQDTEPPPADGAGTAPAQ